MLFIHEKMHTHTQEWGRKCKEEHLLKDMKYNCENCFYFKSLENIVT